MAWFNLYEKAADGLWILGKAGNNLNTESERIKDVEHMVFNKVLIWNFEIMKKTQTLRVT